MIKQIWKIKNMHKGMPIIPTTTAQIMTRTTESILEPIFCIANMIRLRRKVPIEIMTPVRNRTKNL